ncbi:MAG: PTS IIA-like nitrogen regulatory protein PtsN [Gammaproteobacteria bacterium]|jgi:PTS system nitrogen regulatory IIA component|nr:PTS IIA-like nitrogen-regulatory protein PtsN [Gammaproteobacteria bacterium]MDP6098281.1 PTS IIA-like nitrogen regulatory protein PtsN [Gammaproteobacteria bacterium]|tara:strand:+ start:2347 stop:2796 length:450 start_codon:yes stop_codon:yes gene_type:complete
MQLEDILTPDRCYCQISGVSKKRLLTTIGELIANNSESLESEQVFGALMAREQLGTTGLGNGIAIPHSRVPFCNEIIGALITLDTPIDFDAMDSKPVDLFFVLIVPEVKTDEHVETLAKIAEMLNDEDFCYTLRHTQDSDDLYNIAITY